MAPTLCLVMIVKNSGYDIVPVLKAIRPYINCYCISDTGSIDNTVQLIQEGLDGIPGQIHYDQWEGFSQNRNKVIEYAEAECNTDFYIMLDDSYVLYGGEFLPNILENIPTDVSACYNLKIYNKEVCYYTSRIFTKGQRYEYRVHEIFRDAPTANLPDAIYLVDEPSVLHTLRSLERHKQDIIQLALDRQDYPDNPRPVYFLGITHYMLGQDKEAMGFFKECLELIHQKSLLESTFEAYESMWYMSIIAYKQFIEKKSKESYDQALGLFRDCHDTFPYRAEPLYFMAIAMSIFERGNKKDEILETLEKASRIPIPSVNNVIYDIYLKRIPYALVFNYYRNGQIKQALETIRRFYDPATGYDIKFDNLLVGMNAIKPYTVNHFSSELVVIYATDSVDIPWNGKNFNYKCSGSEFMTVRLAEYLAKQGKLVYVFCVCDGLEEEVNGVQYKSIQEYYPFLKANYTDLLIVLRDTSKLSYLKHVRNVYLWVHDIKPKGDDFQTGPSLRGIVLLTNFHKKKVQSSFSIPDQLIRIIGNTISPNPSLLTIEKKPLSFIFASSPDRGLDRLLRVFQKFILRFPQASLVVYANRFLISNEAQALLASDPEHYQLLERVSPEEIQKAYAEAEYWLYPTHFEETYCITAVEAQYYKCICVTTAVGSLPEIVGQRGVILKNDFDSPELDEEIIKKITFLESSPNVKEAYRNKGHEWASQQVMENIGKLWLTGLA
jgi:glycosyltransferase involved in cell wall biosynthesis